MGRRDLPDMYAQACPRVSVDMRTLYQANPNCMLHMSCNTSRSGTLKTAELT